MKQLPLILGVIIIVMMMIVGVFLYFRHKKNKTTAYRFRKYALSHLSEKIKDE